LSAVAPVVYILLLEYMVYYYYVVKAVYKLYAVYNFNRCTRWQVTTIILDNLNDNNTICYWYLLFCRNNRDHLHLWEIRGARYHIYLLRGSKHFLNMGKQGSNIVKLMHGLVSYVPISRLDINSADQVSLLYCFMVLQ